MTTAPFLAIAIQRTREGADEAYVATMREMFAFVRAEGYGGDRFFRDRETGCYVNIRQWTSAEKAAAAHADSRLRAFWHRLGELSETIAIYGDLDEIDIADGLQSGSR